jgi:hypothetical protein
MRGAAGDEHAASRPLEGRGMHGQQDGAAISHAYQDHRPYLVDLAFQPGKAEDSRRPGQRRFDIASAEHRLVTEKFIAACSNGDLTGLLGVLAPDAWGDVDLGPAAARLDVTVGAENVARNLLRFWGQGARLVSHPVAGQPAVLAFIRRELAGVLVFTMRGELIQEVHVIGDPRKLDLLSSQLTALA